MREQSRVRTLRCAIYTRKSSEEGLEQDFNSLQAQREACEAYIASQRHEGWKALPAEYNDGAFSGGTMVRPALQQLLADIGAGKVDRDTSLPEIVVSFSTIASTICQPDDDFALCHRRRAVQGQEPSRSAGPHAAARGQCRRAAHRIGILLHAE